MDGSESTVNGNVSMPRAARVLREEGERAVAKTRRLAAWKAKAKEWPMPPGEQLHTSVVSYLFIGRHRPVGRNVTTEPSASSTTASSQQQDGITNEEGW